MTEKIGAYIGVQTENFSMHIPLERRITFLRGDSGVGKTSFVNYIRFYKSSRNKSKITVTKPENLSVMIATDENAKSVIKDSKDAIIIIDDDLSSEECSFTNALMKYVIKNNLYILIIDRVELAFDETMSKKFDYSIKSVLWVEKEEGSGSHKVFPVTELLNKYDVSKMEIDYIVSEDVHGLTDLCNSFNRNKNLCIDNTVPKSKDNIVSIIASLCSSKSVDNILLFIDFASFGKNFWDLYTFCVNEEVTVILNSSYECFEYMILMSNLFNGKWTIDNSINNVFSWEQYFERKLEDVSNMVLKHSYHHKRECPICLRIDCKDCTSYEYCDKKVYGNKLEALFKGTRYEFLIKLLNGGKE